MVSVPLKLELLTIQVPKFGVGKNMATSVISGPWGVLFTSFVV